MHRWLDMKEGALLRGTKGNKCKELERGPGNRIQPYLQLTAFPFCGEASLNLLLNNWLPPPCSNTPETLLWFVHKMSPLQISLSEKVPHLPATVCNTRGLFYFLFFFTSPTLSLTLSASNNLQLTFKPPWIIQILFSYQGRSQARQLSFICVLCQSKA